jgi:hypothetical protein
MKREGIVRIVKIAPLALVAVAVFGFAFGFVVMSLWNWLMPTLFGFRSITFWQAIGLLFLSRILLGTFRGGSHGTHWRHRMKERWGAMSPEERERFRERLRRWEAGGETAPEVKGAEAGAE